MVLGSVLCLSLYTWDNKYTRPGTQPLDDLLTLTEEELEQTDLHFLIHGWAFYPDVLLTPEEWRRRAGSITCPTPPPGNAPALTSWTG